MLYPFKLNFIQDVQETSFADQILKKLHLEEYQDLRYIPPTSNHVERFFSACKLVISNLRKSMLPKKS